MFRYVLTLIENQAFALFIFHEEGYGVQTCSYYLVYESAYAQNLHKDAEIFYLMTSHWLCHLKTKIRALMCSRLFETQTDKQD